jgi:hypothetical protein
MIKQIRLTTRDANPAYVEEKLGQELYSHLRGADRVADFRRHAATEAHRLYEEAKASGAAESELAGLGLLVLQRALLAAEDLGAVLWALADEPRWLRFTSYRPGDLDRIYRDLARGQLSVNELWLLPSESALREELPADAAEAALRLRHLTEKQIIEQLELVAAYWLGHRVGVKAVMHGFGLISSSALEDPLGAGVLDEIISKPADKPFAVSLVSRVDRGQKHVETAHHVLDLSPPTVAHARATAEAACDLLESLASARVFAVQTQHAYVLGDGLAGHLTPEERRVLAKHIGGEDNAPT